MRRHRRPAFTLPELMVVIMVIALLVAIVTPTLSSVYKYANQTQCAGNLNRIGVGLNTLAADARISGAGSLSVMGWRGQIMPYVSNAGEVLLCPDGRSSGITEGNLGMYALATYSGSTFIYNMPMAEGPSCRKENVQNNGMTFDLSFEDQRTSTGDPTGDFSFANPILTIQFIGTDVKVTVKGGGGGYHWHLVDSEGTVLMNDILKSGPGVGDSIMLGGVIGEYSYGLNSVIRDIPAGAKRIMGLDYPADIVRIAGPDEIKDNWLEWTEPDGSYSFARHFGECNVLMRDGTVVRISPEKMDPTDPDVMAKYWRP